MVKRKRTKEQTTIYKILHRKRDRGTQTTLTTDGELRCYGRVGSSCSTIDTRDTLVTNPVIGHE